MPFLWNDGMTTKSPLRGTAGFTLLEAIVALTVMALALIPLVSFIAQAANELQRAGDSNERSFVTQSVLALMDPINPMEEPKGELPLDGHIYVSWRSDTIVDPPEGLLAGAALSGFRLGFYTVHVSVSRDRDSWFEFDLRKVGYTRLQTLSPFSSEPIP
jgi:Tfp pilus assembly protein PilV